MGDVLMSEEPTIRCRALLNFRCLKFGKEYDLPDDERTWMYIGMGLLEEVWSEADWPADADDWPAFIPGGPVPQPHTVEVDDGTLLRRDATPDT